MEKSWNIENSESYKNFNVLKDEKIITKIKNFLNNYTKDKIVVDIGCGDGTMKNHIVSKKYINIDPFPPKNNQNVIKKDGISFLKESNENSFDIILVLFSLHHMDKDIFLKECNRCLKENGLVIQLNISEDISLFNNFEFDKIFTKSGFVNHETKELDDKLSIDIPINYEFLKKMIIEKSWSNINYLNDKEIEKLISLIPRDIERITITIIVKLHKFD